MEQQARPFERDEQGFTVVPPEAPYLERLRVALGTRPDEPLRFRARTNDRIWATGELADPENPFSPGLGIELRSDARRLAIPVPDALVDDAGADLWGYVQEEAERRAAAEPG